MQYLCAIMSKISSHNKKIIHGMIEDQGFDCIFNEGRVTNFDGMEPDTLLDQLVRDYQKANNALMKYIER
jgi:hypothetical protein